MTKSRNTSVEAETISQNVFDIVRSDRVEIGIMCPLCYNHYGLALSIFAVLDWISVSCLR